MLKGGQGSATLGAATVRRARTRRVPRENSHLGGCAPSRHAATLPPSPRPAFGSRLCYFPVRDTGSLLRPSEPQLLNLQNGNNDHNAAAACLPPGVLYLILGDERLAQGQLSGRAESGQGGGRAASAMRAAEEPRPRDGAEGPARPAHSGSGARTTWRESQLHHPVGGEGVLAPVPPPGSIGGHVASQGLAPGNDWKAPVLNKAGARPGFRKLSVKGHVVYILSFVGHISPHRAYSTFMLQQKSHQRQRVNEWA